MENHHVVSTAKENKIRKPRSGAEIVTNFIALPTARSFDLSAKTENRYNMYFFEMVSLLKDNNALFPQA